MKRAKVSSSRFQVPGTFLAILLSAFILCSPAYGQQENVLRKNSWNIGIWTGGGSGVNGRTKDTHLWLTGARFGKVLCNERGHGMWRGQLEYSIEAIPAFVVFQDSTVYGFDVTPLLFRWDFTSSRKWMPYFELGAGTLLTTEDVPERTFPVNFTPQAGFGFHVFTAPRQAITLTFKFMHISNAGLDSPNPGINSLQVLVGYQWLR